MPVVPGTSLWSKARANNMARFSHGYTSLLTPPRMLLSLPPRSPAEARAKSKTIQLGSYQHEWTNPITTKEAMDSLLLNSSTPAAKKLWGRATSLQVMPPANYITSERNIKSSDSSPPTWPTPSHQAASISLIYDAAHTKQCNLIALLITRLQHARMCSNLHVIGKP